MMMNKVHPVLIYSPFALGKTALLADLVAALGLKARIYTVETYGEFKDLMAAGQVEVWKFNNRPYPWDTCQKACDGFWPTDVVDGLAGIDPKGQLVAPTMATWEEWPIRIYEGLATISEYIAGNYAIGGLTYRIGHGESVGPTDSGELIRITDGDTTVGGLSRSNYGFVQREMLSNVARSQAYPGYIIWTAHEDDVAEKKGKVATGNVIIGPQVIGAALTNYIGKDFADIWRIVGVPTDIPVNGEMRHIIERRLYLKEHVDPLSATLVAKGRNSAGKKNQGSVVDYIRLTDPEKPGQPREGVGKILVEMLKL